MAYTSVSRYIFVRNRKYAYILYESHEWAKIVKLLRWREREVGFSGNRVKWLENNSIRTAGNDFNTLHCIGIAMSKWQQADYQKMKYVCPIFVLIMRANIIVFCFIDFFHLCRHIILNWGLNEDCLLEFCLFSDRLRNLYLPQKMHIARTGSVHVHKKYIILSFTT